MMLMPLSAGVVLVRDERDLDAAFTQRAPYLFHGAEGERSPDQGKRSFQCSRRLHALKVWVALQRYGAGGTGVLYDPLRPTDPGPNPAHRRLDGLQAPRAASPLSRGSLPRPPPNPDFLPVDRLVDDLLRPCDLVFRPHTGPIILEFPSFPRTMRMEPAEFHARLDRFLQALPAGFAFATARQPSWRIRNNTLSTDSDSSNACDSTPLAPPNWALADTSSIATGDSRLGRTGDATISSLLHRVAACANDTIGMADRSSTGSRRRVDMRFPKGWPQCRPAGAGAAIATRKKTKPCLLYTSDAADERSSVDLGGRRIIKKKKTSDARYERRMSHSIIRNTA